MFIFLDESGDLGFDFENKKSSTHFCITLLVCHQTKTLSSLKSVVKNTLVRMLNHNKMKAFIIELKGTNTSLRVKKYFYKQLEDFYHPVLEDLMIYSITVDKQKFSFIERETLKTRNKQHSIYNILTWEVLSLVDFSSINNQVIFYLDKCKSREERNIFDHQIRSFLEIKLQNFSISVDIKHELSHEHSGLQAADLFCYGFFRKYALKDTSWYDVFSKRIIKEILWKPKF